MPAFVGIVQSRALRGLAVCYSCNAPFQKDLVPLGRSHNFRPESRVETHDGGRRPGQDGKHAGCRGAPAPGRAPVRCLSAICVHALLVAWGRLLALIRLCAASAACGPPGWVPTACAPARVTAFVGVELAVAAGRLAPQSGRRQPGARGRAAAAWAGQRAFAGVQRKLAQQGAAYPARASAAGAADLGRWHEHGPSEVSPDVARETGRQGRHPACRAHSVEISVAQHQATCCSSHAVCRWDAA